jgi:hypothetical protein
MYAPPAHHDSELKTPLDVGVMAPPVLKAIIPSSIETNQPRENTQISKHELLNERTCCSINENMFGHTIDASILQQCRTLAHLVY